MNGIHSILPTPFDARENLDESSLRRLVDAVIAAGVDGVVTTGVFGEADRLEDDERVRVIEIVVDQTAGRVPVTVGVTHPALRVVVARTLAAERIGAAAVMVAPLVTDRDFVDAVCASTHLSVVIQDYPDATGVRLPLDYLASLEGVLVKLEEAPTAPKIAELHRRVPAMPIFGGRGAVEAVHDLAAGATGFMTGFSYPEVLVEIYSLWKAGKTDEAYAIYNTHLPLILFENQPRISLGIRKEIIRRRGLIDSGITRSPRVELDPHTLATLDGVVARLEREPGNLLNTVGAVR